METDLEVLPHGTDWKQQETEIQILHPHSMQENPHTYPTEQCSVCNENILIKKR